MFLTITSIALAPPSAAANAKKSFTKATVGRTSIQATPSPGRPADVLLEGLDGKVLEDYDDITLVEIIDSDKDKLKQRGNAQSVLVRMRDDFDKVFLNGRVLDAREDKEKPPPGEKHDPPYKNDEQGTWIIQFIGAVKPQWIDRIKAEGIVPVQPVSMNAYIVGGRESAIKLIEGLPYIQYTMQMHRFLKPSIGQPAEESVELWIELAETAETDDAVELLEKVALGPIESAQWSEPERRVQGVFATKDLDIILAQPLVIGIAERPKIGFSDERAVLGLTTLVPSTGSPAPEAGKYKKWLGDLCASCSNLQGDGFYVGIADSGLDGGDKAVSGNGTIPGEVGSSNLHRDELAANRIVWGNGTFALQEDTTNSKHDTIGHGTLVAGIAAGNPLLTGGKDADGFLWGLGVAPSAGLAITKISTPDIATGTRPVTDVTRDARSVMSPRAYWQNYSLNEYYYAVQDASGCDRYRDGGYSILSRDFDAAVRDADILTSGNQHITITTSSGNVHQQLQNGLFWNEPGAGCLGLRTLTLPPATAKNVIAVGGAESVRPDPWLCRGTRADGYTNLAMDAKHGTRIAGWHKPDLIAVTTSIASVLSNDSQITDYCTPDGAAPSVPLPYLASAGTSFAAPAGLGAAVLASRRYSNNPAKAKPALVKAMLIAGAKSMRGGKDRVTLRTWKPGARYYPGNRVLPRVPNGNFYEVEAVGSSVVSRLNSGVELLEADARVVRGELPVDLSV